MYGFKATAADRSMHATMGRPLPISSDMVRKKRDNANRRVTAENGQRNVVKREDIQRKTPMRANTMQIATTASAAACANSCNWK